MSIFMQFFWLDLNVFRITLRYKLGRLASAFDEYHLKLTTCQNGRGYLKCLISIYVLVTIFSKVKNIL